jgi:small-conductance mechanosensitive channel
VLVLPAKVEPGVALLSSPIKPLGQRLIRVMCKACHALHDSCPAHYNDVHAFMALTTGGELGPYEILSPLGAGGLGEVYRAQDTRLDRPVAIARSASRFKAEKGARSLILPDSGARIFGYNLSMSSMIRCWRVLLFSLLLGASAKSLPGAAPSVLATPDRLLQFLNQSVSLYHQTVIQQRIASEPQEQFLLYNNRQLANQSVQLALQFARAQVDAMAAAQSVSAPTEAPSGVSQQYSSLRQMLAKLDKQLKDTQAESDSDRQQMAAAKGVKRSQLQSQISELQGEIALSQARRDAVRSMLEFVGGSATGGMSASALRTQIDALASSVPAGNATESNQSHGSEEPSSVSGAKAAPSTIWDLIADLFSLSSKLRTVKAMNADTNALLETSNTLRTPFITQLRSLSNLGDQLAAQADTADRATLAQERQQLDALAERFRQVVADVTPLSKQRVLLNLYQANLDSWRSDIFDRYKSDLRMLFVRLGALALILAVLVGLSELWRRAIYRYVHEPRRRHQFLLLRKIGFWFTVAVVLFITVAGKFGSVATFAGLLTAGVAFALQNVLVSIVGYFFLIGKFGIRVGDHIEVSGISGEVIEIGLVRFHVMELGAGATPTGRVVAFSNSIVFQPAAGLFKRIPGASFAWHHVTLTVPSDADFGVTNKRLVEAVDNILADYRAQIEAGYQRMEKTGILISDYGLRPQLEAHLTANGVETTIRYPVDIQHATEIDARVSRGLLAVLERRAERQPQEGTSVRVQTDLPANRTTG